MGRIFLSLSRLRGSCRRVTLTCSLPQPSRCAPPGSLSTPLLCVRRAIDAMNGAKGNFLGSLPYPFPLRERVGEGKDQLSFLSASRISLSSRAVLISCTFAYATLPFLSTMTVARLPQLSGSKYRPYFLTTSRLKSASNRCFRPSASAQALCEKKLSVLMPATSAFACSNFGKSSLMHLFSPVQTGLQSKG